MNPDSFAFRPAPISRRRSQVYVQIPSSYSPNVKDGSYSGDSLKENTPLRPPRMNSDSSMSSLTTSSSHSRKRKLSDASGTVATRGDATKSNTKKAKLSTADNAGTATGDKAKAKKSSKTWKRAEEATEEFPNGAFYCHQCNKKRDVSVKLACSGHPLYFQEFSSNVSDNRCKAKYCKACLKNRYGQDMDEIKTMREKHVADEGFFFQCPRCKDECNGLEATGNLTLAARKAGKESAARLLAEDPKTMGILPGKGQQVAPEKKPRNRTKKASDEPIASTSSEAVVKPAPKPRGRRKAGEVTTAKPRAAKSKASAVPKVLPQPIWSHVYTDLDLTAAEMRMNIREFVLRFAAIMDIGKGNQDELEELETPIARWSLPDQDEDEDEILGWASEPCTKAIILGLLSFIADDANAADEKAIKDSIKDIRASGGNLTKIWAALASLRDELELRRHKLVLDFPDPLPPPVSATFHNTRSGNQVKGIEANVYVACSAQLIPVIASLLESTLQTKVIRAELERGAAEEKELAKQVKEAVNKENAKYKDSRASGSTAKGALKAEREQHKQALLDLENAHRLAAFTGLPRFSALGRDHEGRVYYALTPGAAEREAALQLLAGKDGKVRIRRRGLTEEDRQGMRRWSWFIAVWGKAPNGAIIHKDDDDDDDEDEDMENDRWWGFWQPEEVKKVAEWIAIKCDLGEDDSRHVSEELENGPIVRKDKGKAVDRFASVTDTLASLDQSREPSPLSDISSNEDEEADEDDEELYDGMCVDSDGRPVPTKHNLHELVRGLQEYADLLQWRIQRVEGSAVNEKDSGIAGAVSAKNFYG
ncbi:hypothetical protein B0H21DRAFT_716488 [Amylocystis lapponica]|nr:hypothetical protein B0H21DRAFT_716488 [Amylocystis lapponica]